MECLPCGVFFSTIKGFTAICEAFLTWRFLFPMAFQVSQDADRQGQESGEARFYPAAKSSGNHRAQHLVVEEHGTGGPADHGGAGVHEEGEAVQYFSYELAAHDDDGDAHHESEDYQKEIAVGGTGDREDIVDGHEEICQNNGFHRHPQIIGCFYMGIFIARCQKVDGNGNQEDAAQHLEIGNGKKPYGHSSQNHAEAYGAYGADEDGFLPLLFRKAVGSHGNDHRIIAAQG